MQVAAQDPPANSHGPAEESRAVDPCSADAQPSFVTVGWMQAAARWWYVARYYRMSQIARRAIKLVPRRNIRARGNPGKLKLRGNTSHSHLLAHRPATDDVFDPERGAVRLLNEERVLGRPIDWRCDRVSPVSPLWRFRLHYHEFLLPHAMCGQAEIVWQVVQEWIERNPPTDSSAEQDAWHPYCISRRLPVWIALWSACPLSSDLGDRVLESMALQADSLDRTFEWDLRGNHLFLNATTLALMGCFFSGSTADRWLERSWRVLKRQVEEQLLPHGEHVERSPMYHAQLLQALLDVRDAAKTVHPELSEFCGRTAERMLDWLDAVLHPDGKIPLLGDSCFDETPAVGELQKRSDRSLKPNVANRVGGELVGPYWTYRDGDNFLLFDAGPVGPDWLPAHAHADLLNIEASVAGQRLFVDSGNYEYHNSAMRQYCRSTRAHNVLQIDETDQCDMWSRFRMGYRGWPSVPVSGQEEGVSWCYATHNAYRRIGVPVVGRWLGCRGKWSWVCVDWARGTGHRQLTPRLHLHTDVSVKLLSDNTVELTVGTESYELRFFGPGTLAVEPGFYCPRFGHRVRSKVLCFAVVTGLPHLTGWSMCPVNSDGHARLILAEDNGPTVRWSDGKALAIPVDR